MVGSLGATPQMAWHSVEMGRVVRVTGGEQQEDPREMHCLWYTQDSSVGKALAARCVGRLCGC
jgi:hypothetical protein